MSLVNKLISLFFLLFCFFNIAHAFEDCSNNAVRFENFSESKATPLVKHIITNNEGVFLQIGNDWIATEGLQISKEGTFVLVYGEWITLAEALDNPECVRATWKCGVCGFINYDGISACAVCGTPRPKKRG